MTVAKSPRRIRAPVTLAKRAVAGKATAAVPATVAQARAAAAAAAAKARGSTPVSASAAKPKPKLVRDSFTIPKSEYSVLESLKVRAANLTRPVKKSELLRAGIAALNAMNDGAFLAALNGVPSLKTGRPKGPDATTASRKVAK